MADTPLDIVARKLDKTVDELTEVQKTLAGHARDLDGPPRLRDDVVRAHSRLDTVETQNDTPKLIRVIDGVTGDWFERMRTPGAAAAWKLTKSVIRWGIVITLLWFAIDTAMWYRSKEDAKVQAIERGADAGERVAVEEAEQTDAIEDLADDLDAAVGDTLDDVSAATSATYDEL